MCENKHTHKMFKYALDKQQQDAKHSYLEISPTNFNGPDSLVTKLRIID